MTKKLKTAADEAATPTADYEVLTPLRHDGDDYAIGDTIALHDSQAAALLAVAAITLAKPPAA